MLYKFTIIGNETDHKGNARPKSRLTSKQLWTTAARRYGDWKKHVVTSFLASLEQQERRMYYHTYIANGKPILNDGEKVRMDIKIYWKSNAHGDPENIFGSIADALFKQDKFLVGSFDFSEVDIGDGKVEVSIKLP